MLDQESRDNFQEQRYQLIDALGLLNLIEGARTAEQLNKYRLQYAELLITLVKRHLNKAMQESICDEGQSNARAVADIEVGADGKIKFTEEF